MLARGRDYLLSPQVPYERVGDVPNVVFPCAALVDRAADRVAIYYEGRGHRRLPRLRVPLRDRRVRAVVEPDGQKAAAEANAARPTQQRWGELLRAHGQKMPAGSAAPYEPSTLTPRAITSDEHERDDGLRPHQQLRVDGRRHLVRRAERARVRHGHVQVVPDPRHPPFPGDLGVGVL